MHTLSATAQQRPGVEGDITTNPGYQKQSTITIAGDKHPARRGKWKPPRRMSRERQRYFAGMCYSPFELRMIKQLRGYGSEAHKEELSMQREWEVKYKAE